MSMIARTLDYKNKVPILKYLLINCDMEENKYLNTFNIGILGNLMLTLAKLNVNVINHSCNFLLHF